MINLNKPDDPTSGGLSLVIYVGERITPFRFLDPRSPA